MSSRRRRINFYLDPELEAGLKILQEREGVTPSESMRRAIRVYLEMKIGFDPKPRLLQVPPAMTRTRTKADRPRARTRKRS